VVVVGVEFSDELVSAPAGFGLAGGVVGELEEEYGFPAFEFVGEFEAELPAAPALPAATQGAPLGLFRWVAEVEGEPFVVPGVCWVCVVPGVLCGLCPDCVLPCCPAA